MKLSIAFVFLFLYCINPIALAASPPISLQNKLAQLETSAKGRIGVYAINTRDNTHLQYRADERFPFCSTFKFMAVSAILKQSMSQKDLLQKKIIFHKNDLFVYSPITEKHTDTGMTVAEFCAATLMYSDNTAVNLLMKEQGGLHAVNAFAKSIGDHSFRLDRYEPDLNSAIPGDLRDTTTPKAMAESLQRIVLGNVLDQNKKSILQTWLKHNTTGNFRIRAGVPKNWIVADKTGTGDYGTTNDIAVIWPPACPPIVMAIYFTQQQKNARFRDDVIAKATALLINEFVAQNECQH